MEDSAPWQLGEWDLLDDLAAIERQWDSIAEILEDRVLFDLSRPEVSAWSCGQHAGHMVMVAQTIADRVEGNLSDPDRHREEVLPELAQRVLSAGRIRRGSATSPPEVNPESRRREDFLPMLPAAIESWGRVRARAPELPGCVARYPHFRLGYMSSAEWVRMCAIHTAHHLGLVRDIRL